MKDLADFDTDEVGMWLVAIGLGKKVESFQENAVDGKLLVELSDEDLKGDLGLSGLQAKKVTTSIEAFKELTSGGGGDGSGNDEQIAKLMQQVENLEAENASLKQEIAKLKAAANPTPPPPSKPAPAPAAAPPPRKEHHVIRETGRGAARGAILGAVGGAIAGDAGKGAKMGAAMGATGGAMRGVAARRRGRFR